MKYFELEMHGDHMRVEWNEKATFNIQTPVGGQWVDFNCFTCYGIDSEHEALETAYEWINQNIFEFSEA
jgi:hypothetical protein